MLDVKNLYKRYHHEWLLQDLSLTVGVGEILALLGPSGCGKSTLLGMIAGLVPPSAGVICFAGQDLAGTPPEKRNFALMFQDYALFPHLNVLRNVGFGLVERGIGRSERRVRAEQMLAAVGLAGYGGRDVTTLSGGEAQRVALARALVIEPRLLLLDEPFSSLDAHLRLSLQSEFRAHIKARGMSAVMVTHDRHEAFAMADRVAVLNHGRVAQLATPEALLAAPGDDWVAQFIGYENLTVGRVIPDAAFQLGEGPRFEIVSLAPGAQGVRLQVRHPDGERYTLSLSAREVRALGGDLRVGAPLALRIDETACIPYPKRAD